mmetsp:Transcript_1145/g.3018  ORF Transcript_1145/g.3018 Transcript_1145/m.3018 type:complete len:262 (-) Transcript_1145:369-1154(-)
MHATTLLAGVLPAVPPPVPTAPVPTSPKDSPFSSGPGPAHATVRAAEASNEGPRSMAEPGPVPSHADAAGAGVCSACLPPGHAPRAAACAEATAASPECPPKDGSFSIAISAGHAPRSPIRRKGAGTSSSCPESMRSKSSDCSRVPDFAAPSVFAARSRVPNFAAPSVWHKPETRRDLAKLPPPPPPEDLIPEGPEERPRSIRVPGRARAVGAEAVPSTAARSLIGRVVSPICRCSTSVASGRRIEKWTWRGSMAPAWCRS